MESYKLTLNADSRYYIDEAGITNPDSLCDTITKFNAMKFDLFNQLYNKSICKTGPLAEGVTYSQYLKMRYKTNDYYNAAIYATASGVLSAQKELYKFNIQTQQGNIIARKEKIKSVKEKLDQKRAIKKSIVTYLKTGKWERPYPKCRLKVISKKIQGFMSKPVSLEEYERRIEADIRKLKNRMANLQEGLRHANQRIDKIKKDGVKRVLFGSKAFFKQKDDPDTDLDAWKKEFHDRRYHSISLSGRHTSKYGNFLAKYDAAAETLTVTCMDGKETVFHAFRLARYHDLFLEKFRISPDKREAICYNFSIETDHKGRKYIIPSVTMNLSCENKNSGFSDGCVAIDINVDHFAVSDIDRNGKRLETICIPFNLYGKSTGQAADTIGRAMSVVGKFCQDRKKCLVMEDIDLQKKKTSLRYGNRKRNQKVSSFAYAKMKTSALAQGFKRGFSVYTTNPAYTSFIGKVRYMRPMGISVHGAASYVIGLRGMGMEALCTPPAEIADLLPQEHKKKDIWAQWRYIYNALKGIRTHAFYMKIDSLDWGDRKIKTLRGLSAILKEKDNLQPVKPENA